MKRRVRWAQEALTDYKNQIEYIARENEGAARRLAGRVREAGTRLGQSPVGRAGHRPGTYELVVSGTPYLIIYTLPEDRPEVVILRVFHGAQDWRSDLDDDSPS